MKSNILFRYFILKTFAYVDIEFQSVEKTIGRETFSEFGLKFRRINKTTKGFFGIVKLLVVVDDTFLAGAVFF